MITTHLVMFFFGGASVGGGVPEPEAVVRGGGGWFKQRSQPKRKRYLLPDGTLVWATREEIQAILEQFVEPEIEKPALPLTKRQKRKAKKEAPFVPIQWEELGFEPVKDVQVETFRPVLPKGAIWAPDPRKLAEEVKRLKRRRKLQMMLLLS